MLGMGMVIRPRDFVEIVLEPKPMITGMLYQLVGIPLLTVVMITDRKLLFQHIPDSSRKPRVGGGSLSTKSER
jgi:hypothetical protein